MVSPLAAPGSGVGVHPATAQGVTPLAANGSGHGATPSFGLAGDVPPLRIPFVPGRVSSQGGTGATVNVHPVAAIGHGVGIQVTSPGPLGPQSTHVYPAAALATGVAVSPVALQVDPAAATAIGAGIRPGVLTYSSLSLPTLTWANNPFGRPYFRVDRWGEATATTYELLLLGAAFTAASLTEQAVNNALIESVSNFDLYASLEVMRGDDTYTLYVTAD